MTLPLMLAFINQPTSHGGRGLPEDTCGLSREAEFQKYLLGGHLPGSDVQMIHPWRPRPDEPPILIADSGLAISLLCSNVFSKAALSFYHLPQPCSKFSLVHLRIHLRICWLQYHYRMHCHLAHGLHRPGPCFSRVSKTQGLLNIIGDSILLLMPIPTIFSLRRPLRQKLAVYSILAVGSGQVFESRVSILLLATCLDI